LNRNEQKKGDPAAKKDNGKTARPSRAIYDELEEMSRMKVQEFIQDISNEEIAEFLGRGNLSALGRLKWSGKR